MSMSSETERKYFIILLLDLSLLVNKIAELQPLSASQHFFSPFTLVKLD